MVRHLAVQHRLARRAGDRDLEVVEVAAAAPDRERAEALAVRGQLGDERVRDAERRGQVTHQRREEAAAGLGLDPLHDGAQGAVLGEKRSPIPMLAHQKKSRL